MMVKKRLWALAVAVVLAACSSPVAPEVEARPDPPPPQDRDKLRKPPKPLVHIPQTTTDDLRRRADEMSGGEE